MKRATMAGAMCAAAALVAGCDYTVPLVETPAAEIDAAVAGVWQRPGADGKSERLLVLPLGSREYLVSFPAGTEGAMFARGCLWRDGNIVLVQLDWIGTAQGKLPEDERTYQYAAYALDGGTLRIRLLDPAVVPRDAATAEDLRRAIAENMDNPRLFRDEMVFTRVRDKAP